MTKSAGAAARCNQRPSGAPSRLATYAPGKRAANHRQPEIEATDRRIDEHARVRTVERPVDEREPSLPPIDRARHDPDRDEGDVVHPQPAAAGEHGREHEGEHDRERERDRSPADRQIAEQLGVAGRTRRR